jgi:cytochrome b pre-mRNA-processing protein 3
MIFAHWRARRAAHVLIDHIHGEIVAAAREPTLYTDCGVPDDLDGRFEMTTLHADLLLRRLADLGQTDLAQEVVDRVFEGFDDALREMSISDVGVAKRMKKMANAYFGRAGAYGPALTGRDADALAAALARNALRAGDAPTPASRRLAARTLAIQALLAQAPLEAFLSGGFRYPLPETASSTGSES